VKSQEPLLVVKSVWQAVTNS